MQQEEGFKNFESLYGLYQIYEKNVSLCLLIIDLSASKVMSSL